MALPAGALAAGLIAGFLGGRAQRPPTEVEDLRREVRSLVQVVALSLLENESPSERLLGVRYGREAGTDARVLEALLDVVRYDPNVNVRLAAVDALAPTASGEPVRQELLAAIDLQGSPLVQIALLDLLLAVDGAEMERALSTLLRSGQLDREVGDHLKQRLELNV
jgi:hypothetical protein